MDMIEKCCRALCDSVSENPDATVWCDDDKKVKLWESYIEDVRTVILALREPSDKMVYCIAAHLDQDLYPFEDCKQMFVNAIDTALDDQNVE